MIELIITALIAFYFDLNFLFLALSVFARF